MIYKPDAIAAIPISLHHYKRYFIDILIRYVNICAVRTSSSVYSLLGRELN